MEKAYLIESLNIRPVDILQGKQITWLRDTPTPIKPFDGEDDLYVDYKCERLVCDLNEFCETRLIPHKLLDEYGEDNLFKNQLYSNITKTDRLKDGCKKIEARWLIAISPEIEELLGKPMETIRRQKESINSLYKQNESLLHEKSILLNMNIWQRIKCLFKGAIYILTDNRNIKDCKYEN